MNGENVNIQSTSEENAVLHTMGVNMFQQKPFSVTNLHHKEFQDITPVNNSAQSLNTNAPTKIMFDISPISHIEKYSELRISLLPSGGTNLCFTNGAGFVLLQNAVLSYVNKIISQRAIPSEYHWLRYLTCLDKASADAMAHNYLYFFAGLNSAHQRAFTSGHEFIVDVDVGQQRLNRDTLKLLSAMGQVLRVEIELPATPLLFVPNTNSGTGSFTGLSCSIAQSRLRLHTVHLMDKHANDELNRVDSPTGVFDLVDRIEFQSGTIPINSTVVDIELTHLRDTYKYLACFFWPSGVERESTSATKGAITAANGLGYGRLATEGYANPEISYTAIINTTAAGAVDQGPAGWTATYGANTAVVTHNLNLSAQQQLYTEYDIVPQDSAAISYSITTSTATAVTIIFSADPTTFRLTITPRSGAISTFGAYRIGNPDGSFVTTDNLPVLSNFDYAYWNSSVGNYKKYPDIAHGRPATTFNYPWTLQLTTSSGVDLVKQTTVHDLCTRQFAEFCAKQGGNVFDSPLPRIEYFPVPILSFGEMPFTNQNAITGVKDFAVMSSVTLRVDFRSSSEATAALQSYQTSSGATVWNYMIMGVGPNWLNRARSKMNLVKI